jgi:hypothetical protein
MEVPDYGDARLRRCQTMEVPTLEVQTNHGGANPWRCQTLEVLLDHAWRYQTMEVPDYGDA